MEKKRLGRDVFIALAAIGWADGKLDGEEADAIVRTAADEGLEFDEIAAIEKATQEPVALGVLDKETLTKEDRLFVYAVAAWMTRLDGKVTDNELGALDKLGDAMGIPPGSRKAADAIAQDVALLPDGDRPLRYDLTKLRRIIAERLEESARRKPIKA
jgi:uncharacterized membrane protein YebE (DUF533 family)